MIKTKPIKKAVGLILLIVLIICALYITKPPNEPVKTLYKTNTKSGRPVIYLQDENGKVELVSERDVEFIEQLENKYKVLEKD